LIILLTYIIVFAIIISIPIVIIPLFAGDITSANIDTQQLIKSLQAALAQQYSVLGFTIHPSALLDQLIVTLRGFIQPVIGQTVTIVMSIITSIIWIIFIILVSFYLIKDGTRLEEWFT
jgi:predicted PurR-regulated permease PerM